MPFAEVPDRGESRLDGALLKAWGTGSRPLVSIWLRHRLGRFVRRVERAERRLETLADSALRATADELRARFVSACVGSEEMILAFGLAREAARRHRGLRHTRVQLLGGAVMMSGALAEMQTGEGKSLTALLPAITAGLIGRPVHIVTVNDYLARRDAVEFAPVFRALGLSTGLIEHGQPLAARQRSYASDVTYCTNKELVFDYLRDRLALGSRRTRACYLVDEVFNSGRHPGTGRLLLRGLHFAIVDEADSVLIDEARTPLILSGMQDGMANDVDVYSDALAIARRLATGTDFELLASERRTRLTPQGVRRVRELASGQNGVWRIRRAREQVVRQALAALHFYHRDMQYIVADDKVQIVDEYTGRVMPDRSWEHGMHQLIEAKENVTITRRNQTLEKITYQQFFRRYRHLCGMTGTAREVSGELRAVYGLRVVCVPTNRPLKRTDCGSRLFKTGDAKWNAVIDAATSTVGAGRSVLIGTRSVGASEHIADLLSEAGLEPVVLNARQDQEEAMIVAEAGQPGRITVATNMAGRGTDIQLHPDVRAAGGLHVILTEYHESRRIDRQLFGRAGRQGDPGSYEAIVALDDELFRRFGSKGLLWLMAGTATDGVPIDRTLGLFLRLCAQAAAERLHSRIRRSALADGRRFAKALGFAGRE